MLIKFLINMGVKKVYLAGIDGYSIDPSMNYGNIKMVLYNKKAQIDVLNEGMNCVLREFSKEIDIEFVTTQKFINI